MPIINNANYKKTAYPDFSFWHKYIQQTIGTESWITVHEIIKTNDYDYIIHCSFIPTKMKPISLSKCDWDMQIDDGTPKMMYPLSENDEYKYYQYGNDMGLEPLIIQRNYYGMRDEQYEISQQFIHFFNLCHDITSKSYLFINNNGDEEEVIKFVGSSIQIKLSFLKEYISAKDMLLAIYIDAKIFSLSPLENIKILDIDTAKKIYRGSNYIYQIGIYKWDPWIPEDNNRSCGLLLGKKLIKGISNYKRNFLQNGKRNQYEKYIYKINKNGKEIIYTCENVKLTPNIYELSNTPHYLTPIFFRRDVLRKYFDNPSKYKVEDGYLYCGSLWGLHIDNSHSKYVICFLGDLGKLDHNEQLYWKSFNIPPDGKISVTFFQRSMMAMPVKPEAVDLLFKYEFKHYCDKWRHKYKWNLFIPLTIEDMHHLHTLRIPLNNNQKEFDEQILSLVKIIIDSLNESELNKYIPGNPDDLKGINKLNTFLISHKVSPIEIISFLKKIQELRSCGVAHRKGSNYRKILNKYNIDLNNLSNEFEKILAEAIRIINLLDIGLLSNN